MSIHMSVLNAQARLSELVEGLDRGGEEIVLTAGGRPVARLTSVAAASSAQDALSLLQAAREGSTPGDASARDLIDAGR